jgi:hypothetical protein
MDRNLGGYVDGVSHDPLSAIHLRRTQENVDEIAEATRRWGRRVGIDGVLEDLNRSAQRVPVPGRAVDWGFRWNDDDVRSQRWWPQGISTSADANDDEDVAGHRLLVTSWYSKHMGGENHGSRVTVVDLDTLRYRHVLLVVPTKRFGRVTLEPLLAHAGGLVWYGHYLHVAGTRRGLFTCLFDDLIRVDSTEATFGHRYVLPVRFAYDAAATDGVEPMRYSFLSLDRGTEPPHLVAGEYARGKMTRRLVRYALDRETRHLSAHEDGTSRPAGLEEGGVGHMQGATIVRDTWYVTNSRGRWGLGTVRVGRPGKWRAFRKAIPVGPEDISYWPSTDRLWSVTEYPGHRYVFCMARATFDR